MPSPILQKLSKSVFTGKTRLLLIATSIAMSGSFHFAYQATSVNPSQNVFKKFINHSYYSHYGSYLDDEQYRVAWSVLTGASLFGDFLGTVLLVTISEKLGRKKGLFLSTALLFLAYILEACSKWLNAFEVFGVGRLIRGISQGWAIDIQAMFLSEISPVEWRGMCGGITEVFVQLGLIAGGILSLPEIFGTSDLWPLLFLIECVPTVITWIVLFFIHDSPKYLLAQGRRDLAIDSLIFYQHTNIGQSMDEIAAEVAHDEKPPSIRQFFSEHHLTRGLIIGSTVWFISTFSGNITIDFFSTHLLIDVGLRPGVARLVTIGLSCMSLIAALLSSSIIDHIGRRPMILTTAVGLVTANTLFMVFTVLYSHLGNIWFGYMCVVVQFLILFSYGIGPAVLQWTVISEVVPQNARSTAIAVSNAVNILLATVNQVAFLPLNGFAGGYSFLLYVIPLVICTLVSFFVFPETKKRSTAHIVENLKQSYGLRRFSVTPGHIDPKRRMAASVESDTTAVSSTSIL